MLSLLLTVPFCVSKVLGMVSSLHSTSFLMIFILVSESVNSLCRDDADMPMPPYIRKACNRANAAFVSLFR